MAVATQLYIPIKGVEYFLVPEVSQRGKNLFETARYAHDNGLVVLPSQDINRVARTVRPERPSKEFVSYARERTDLTDKDAVDAYRKLHEDIWQKYWIRAREVLIWTPTKSEFDHPTIVTEGSDSKSYMMTDYKVDPKEDKFESAPPVPVNWMRQTGTITPEMAQLLGADDNTYVWTSPDPKLYDGLRALGWDFRSPEWPGLYSDFEPRDRNSYWGSLLGRKQ